MSQLKPSDFAKLGNPSCSVWGKSEIEWIALAYVQALANGGDEWKPLTRERCRELLTPDQLRQTHMLLESDFDLYKDWFDSVAKRIVDAEGALSVGGFWWRALHDGDKR